MAQIHPLIKQLRFTRSEFKRALVGLTEEEAARRFMPMNCISWNVGHLAWQEQRYFLYFGQGLLPYPEIQEEFAYGSPASLPSLRKMLATWRKITREADPWLDSLSTESLQLHIMKNGKPTSRVIGNLLQRTIYHYWYHTGENSAIRQMLGHMDLPVFVGNIDRQAPYTPE